MKSSEGKKKRRSKADSEGRTYTCECGKSYFSYQALYTHKKTKHSDTITPEDLPKKKRGRPKLNKSPLNEEQEVETSQPQDPISEKMKNFIKEAQNKTCDEVFAEFLLKKKKAEDQERYLEIKNSIYALRDCINKHSDKVDSNNFFSDEAYTASEKPNLIPNICNFYIMKYLPAERPEHEKQKEIDFMMGFCEWLNEENYTDLEISISQ